MPVDKALEEMKRHSGTRFDPYLVERLISSCMVSVNDEKSGGNKKTNL
jgi:response regulator RpfG family c-di-GMP phosphodiesterase